MLDLNVADGTALHGQQIILFIYLAPANALFQFNFQNVVKPDAGTAAISLSEWMRNIHFDILLNDFIESQLR